MPTIEILTGKGEGKKFEFEQKAVMGRHKSNEVPLPDPRISRKHTRIIQENGTYYVEDLESRNGTFVNGVEIEKQELQSGDQIEMGDTVVVFRGAGSSSSKESASGGTASEHQSQPEEIPSGGGGTVKSGEEKKARSEPVTSGAKRGSGGSTSMIVYIIAFLVLIAIFGLAYFATMKVLPIIFG